MGPAGTAGGEWAGPAGPNFPGGDQHPRNAMAQQHASAQDNALLSKSLMPEFWCSILYFELDTQVSLKFTHSKLELSNQVDCI